MEKEIIVPSEEILQALEEITNIEKEDQSRRRKPKRSSILKQPKSIDDDEADDLQCKRKSLKRRVSFAENFQVLEMNTGNIYDIPGKGVSESTLNEDLSAASKSHAVVTEEKNDIFLATKTNIQVSSQSEMIQIESQHSDLSKKHRIISDEDIEPDKKKLHSAPKDDSPLGSESSNIFIDPTNLMSKFKTYLFDENFDSNTNKDKGITVQDVTLNCKQKSSNLKGVLRENNLGSLKMNKNELVSKTFQKQQISKYADVKSCDIASSDKLSFNYDLTEVKVLPISLSEIPLEQNKENMYIDVKNKNIFFTNILHLKSKDKIFESKNFLNAESHRLKKDYVLPTSDKTLLETESFNPLSSKANESEVKYFRDKTCILDHSMDLTCIPPNLDQEENSFEDGPASEENMNTNYVQVDGTSENHLKINQKFKKSCLLDDKTCVETSLMDLTHIAEVDNVLDSTENDCDVFMQNLQSSKLKMQLDTGDKMNAMEITCHDLDLTCNFLSSTRIDHDTLKLDKTCESLDLDNANEKERCEMEKSFQFSSEVKRISQIDAKETYDRKNKAGLFVCDISNLNTNSKQGDNEIYHSNVIDNCHNEILNSCRNTFQAFKDIKENIYSTSADQIKIVDSHHRREKSMYVSDEMEFTCCEKDLSFEQPENSVTSIKETTSACFKDPKYLDYTVADPNTSPEKILFNKKATSSSTNTDDSSNFAVFSKTQQFASNYMTIKSSLAADKSNDSLQKFFSNTKHFSSLGMELTCIPSVVNSNKSTRKCEVQNEKIVENTTLNSKTQPFVSDHTEVSEKLILYEDKTDYSKTKRFSSIPMDLTCIPSNANLMNSIRHVAEDEKVIEDNTGHSRIQPLKSDCLEMNSKLCLVENKKNYDNGTSKIFSGTKYFSSMNMDLTCISSISNPMNSTRQHVANDEKVIEGSSHSRAEPLVSDYMERIARSSLVENEKSSDNSPSKSSSRTKHFASVGMELTCMPVVNPSSTKKYLSKKESYAEENCILNECHHPEDKLQLGVKGSAENTNEILCKKKLSNYLNATDTLPFPNETNQKFGLNMDVVEDETNRTVSHGETLSKTKRFSSFGMELTCMPSNNNSIIVRKHKRNDEDYLLNKCYPSKYQIVELAPDSKKEYLDNLVPERIPVMSNTLLPPDVDSCFKINIKSQNSICDKDLISESLLVSEDSFICTESNSSDNSVFIPEKKTSLVNADFNKIRSTEVKETLLSKNNPSETQARKNASNSKIILQDVEEMHFNKEFMFPSQSKEGEYCIKKKFNTQTYKADSRQESESQKSNLSVIETSNPNKTHICRKNESPIPKTEICNNSYNNSIETLQSNSDIVYAVKQLKDINQTVDANPFKFPEVFLSLKKQPKSCSKIHLSEPLCEAIRLSGLSNSHIMELNKKYSSPPKNKIVGIPNEVMTEVTDKMINTTPQSDKLNYVQSSCSKTVRKSLSITYGSSPSKKELLEDNVLFTIRKTSETTVRKSLDYNDVVNSNVPNITITHVTQENIIKSIATQDENLFLDSSDLENCSVSLVNNTLDSCCSKLNSENFNESSTIQCKNKTVELLPEQLSKHSMINDHAVLQKSYIDADDQIRNNSLVKQKSVPKGPKVNNLINKKLNADSYEPVINTVQPVQCLKDADDPVKSESSLIKQKSVPKGVEINKEQKAGSHKPIISTVEPVQGVKDKDFSIEKTNQCLEKKERSQLDIVRKINTPCKERGSNSKQTFESLENLNNVTPEIKMNNDLSPVEQNGCGMESHCIISTNSNKSLTLCGKYCVNDSQVHELSNAYPRKKSFDPSVMTDSSSQICMEEVARKSYNVVIEKPKAIVTEISMKDPPVTVDPKEIDSCSILELNEAPLEGNRNKTSLQINSTFMSNENAKDEVHKTPISEKTEQENMLVENDHHSCSKENSLHNINSASTSNINVDCQNIEMDPISPLPDDAENRLPTTPRPLSQSQAFVNKIDFKKIGDLRRKLKSASQNEGCQWTFVELDDKEAVFEILDESPFACYYMHVPISFGSEVSYPAKITFEHSKKDVDEIDELGFSYFLTLVSNYTEISSLGVDKLLENLEKVVECALQTKSLIKDITFISIRHDFCISYSDNIPKLTVEILNFERYSLLSLTFPIDFKMYPEKKITPEIKHLDHNEIKKEIILNALEKIQPGTYYLRNMVKVVNEL